MRDLGPDHPLWRLFQQLRRRGLSLGPDDLLALHQLLAAGFGWASRSALRDVCRALWAKSSDEQAVLDALFDQLPMEDWALPLETAAPTPHDEEDDDPPPPPSDRPPPTDEEGDVEDGSAPEVVASPGRLPPVHIDEHLLSARSFILVPQYPMAFRDVAQSFRRLRRPVRFGPATELDVQGTISWRLRMGVATPPVLVPRRRNTARVLLLVDRDGSMAPFHDFVDLVCRAILETAQFVESARFYFHDLPLEGTNDAALARLPRDKLFPPVDGVLADLGPTAGGWLYRDPDLAEPIRVADVFREHGAGCIAVVISDAGAARGRYDPARVIDSLGLMLALRAAGATGVWINPLPRERWRGTSAGELARHVPMFPLDRDGTRRAVTHLRGQPASVERPL